MSAPLEMSIDQAASVQDVTLPSSPHSTARFVQELAPTDLPDTVLAQAERCLVDLLATAASGLSTPLSRIIRNHAAGQFGASGEAARMLLDGRSVSPVGAALAGGMTIDAFDAHDGHVLTKGHAGAAVLPGLLAVADAHGRAMSGAEFLTLLVIGYEIALRAGIATHRTAKDYHTSGSWNALGVAALAARVLQLNTDALRHALGIAEYHGPRSPMMRCIDHPTMLKDGSGWGAMTGLSAALLARDGFTGAPASVAESADVADLWSDLGQRWRILEMYFKPYPICRWAQPAVEAVLSLRRAHTFAPGDIVSLQIITFHEAVRLATAAPADTEQAQYSLPFPVAAALRHGRLSPNDILGEALRDPQTLALARSVELVEDAALSRRFPAERLARARIVLRDGRTLESDLVPARGDAERPLTDSEIEAKYVELTVPALGAERSSRLREEIAALKGRASVAQLLDLTLAP